MHSISIANEPFPYRIGVDVGGTNTDAVIIDTRIADSREKSVTAAAKTTTSFPSVTDGIEGAVRAVLEESGIDRQRIASLAIGTTHFLNAIVERSERHLSRVAVVRLSKSFTREVPPFSDFPADLRDIIRGYCTQIDGGLQIDGSLEAAIVENQIVEECAQIEKRGISAVVISGVFSPLDHHFHQEQKVRSIINRELPNVTVTCSSEVSNLGFLERENASILNASIHRFAEKTIHEFKMAMRRLGLRCGLYLTQNDGTLLDSYTAARLPIRTFSSGPTNSMRGAAYLCGLYTDGEAGSLTTLVCDVGGTTSDVGVLLPSGYPRQAAGDVHIAGVKVNYGMPHVESIGVGGGSIIRENSNGGVTVGRDSVGYAIRERALIFGGSTTTATDIVVASDAKIKIGDAHLVKGLKPQLITETQAIIKREFEQICDLMKTSPEPLPLILVGGGSIICPPKLDGISEIICPPFHDVANAVGAATARISATVDIVQNASAQTIAEAMQRATAMAIEEVTKAGARPETIVITEKESLPLQYVENKVRTIVKAVGDFSPSEVVFEDITPDERGPALYDDEPIISHQKAQPNTEGPVDINTYRPKIILDPKTGFMTWSVSTTDLEWLAEGCYVLGCGGGGSPYPEMLKLRQHIREGHELRIIDTHSLKKDARIYCKCHFIPLNQNCAKINFRGWQHGLSCSTRGAIKRE